MPPQSFPPARPVVRACILASRVSTAFDYGRDIMKQPNTVIGTDAICAWQPAPGITWVQCRAAEHANRLAKRRDSRLVVRGMAGGYLKTYEFRHSLAWAKRLIRRYTRQNHSANERLSTPATPGGTFSCAGSISTAESEAVIPELLRMDATRSRPDIL